MVQLEARHSMCLNRVEHVSHLSSIGIIPVKHLANQYSTVHIHSQN